MKRVLKWVGGLLAVALLAGIGLVVNVVWFRPFSISLFYEKAFIEFALQDPELLTSIQLLEGFGIDGHNAELTDASPAQTTLMRGLIEKDLEILRSYDRGELEDQQARGAAFQWHDYAIDQFNGVHILLPNFKVDYHQVHSVRDAGHYVSRLSQFGWKFDGLPESLRLREERGIVPPRFAIAGAIEQIEVFTQPGPDDNVLYTSFAAKLDAVDALAADDIREFHDVVLQNGAVPLAILEQQVDAWLAGAR